MGVSDGQLANQTTFNNGFMARNTDTSTTGKVDLKNTDALSGAEIDNIQREMNAAESFTGMPAASPVDALPDWENDDIGTPTDDLMERADALTERFNPTTGHTHNGSDSPKVSAINLDAVRLRGYYSQGAGFSTPVTGTSVDASSKLIGKVPSTGDSVKGVVVASTLNKIIIQDNSGEDIVDAFGNAVYGRLTYMSSVWTLSFYTLVLGVETAYSMVSQQFQWFYQELFNPITDAPIYDPIASIPSDNATAEVVDASPTQRGLVNTTTQSFAGAKSFTDTTDSSSSTTGAVKTAGGLGVAKNINAGGNIAATGTMGASNLSGNNTGDVTLAAVGAAPNANGASLTGQALTLQPADATHPGLMTILAQTLAGVKTWIAGQVLQAFIAFNRLDVASTATIAAFSSANSYAKLTGSTATTVQGIVAGVDGQVITINNGTSATAIFKHQSGSATATNRLKLPSGTDISVDPDSSVAFIYDAAQTRWVVYSGSGSGSGSDAGGLPPEWSESVNAPVFSQENDLGVYLFDASLTQVLWGLVKIPAGYTAGKQIKLKGLYYSPDSSGQIGFSVTAYLVRAGTDLLSYITNAQTSGQTTVLGGGTVNIPQAMVIPLSDASGAFNGVSASPGDLIRFSITRTDTVAATNELRLPKAASATEVTFNG